MISVICIIVRAIKGIEIGETHSMPGRSQKYVQALGCNGSRKNNLADLGMGRKMLLKSILK
jgi:hypothetical protein